MSALLADDLLSHRSLPYAPPRRRREPPRRILVLIDRLNVPGGTERQCIELARAQARRGAEVTILALEGSLGLHSASSDEQVSLRTIGTSRVASALARIHPKLGLAWDMRRLAAAARGHRADVVLAHHYPAHWASARVRGSSGTPTVWLCNDWIYNPLEGFRASRFEKLVRGLLRRVMIGVDAKAARRQDAVLALSHMTGAEIASGYDVEVVVFRTGATAPPPANVSREAARAALGISANAFVVSTICILMPHRRVDDVVRALPRLTADLRDRAVFLHIGASDAPEYLRSLKDLAKQEGVADRVRFLGRVEEDVRVKVLAASDAFVFPVQGQSWGLAPFEAMAASVPAVVSRSSGAAEVLRDGKTALLFDPGDVQKLAAHLQSLATDAALGATLREEGQRFWKTRLTWDRAARRLDRHLSTIVALRGSH